MSIETEAIQVAAVAAALVEDRTRPAVAPKTERSGMRGRRWWDPTALVLDMIHDERKRQEEKWGEQRYSPVEWLMILAEEVGELAAEVERHGGEADARAAEVTRKLGEAGREARAWIGSHPWPERQQRVIDQEKK